MSLRRLMNVCVLGLLLMATGVCEAFEVDNSEQPGLHPPLTPVDGEVASINPPPMIWRVDERAATYTLELAREASFTDGTVRVEGIDLPFYNHSEVLEPGVWYWRYYVVTESGEHSEPAPTKRFVVPEDAVTLPVPPIDKILANMPAHPRIFTTPAELDAFRARRLGPAREAWEHVQWEADQLLSRAPKQPDGQRSLKDVTPSGPTPGVSWTEGQPTRRQVIWLVDDEALWSKAYTYRDLNAAASSANTLSFAYLISGDNRYADAAREWLLFVVNARIDYHLEDRAAHDSVVYCYEQGLRYVALSYDRLYDRLTPQERQRVIDHVAYHVEPAYEYLRDRVKIHLRYQQSHPQQCMHSLLTTVLAMATDLPRGREWTDYLVRQYVNRIAWTSEDGGYFEGQTYGHKFRWILEGLVAMRTACGLDLFKQPRIRNSGRFWLYAMSLNYWYQHGGDVYSLIWPWGNPSDGYIAGLMAAMNRDPYVQWWSDTVFTDPAHIPFHYISQTDLQPRPPVDIDQAQHFPLTGQLAAYDRFYDHLSDRIFFRSSPWGGHSHSHADQNGFVIHAGGEILAADTGYYTYYGDDYHRKWSYTTAPHNSILVNGQGQPKSIDSKGDITAFFHTPDYTFFIGDASRAYEPPLERFERAVLFVRPNVYVVYDELAASEPSAFNWLLNVFDEPDIDASQRRMTIRQQHMRLRVDHLLPNELDYTHTNARPYPILTRAWARVTEAFPQPWHIRVTNAQKQEQVRFLTLMHTFAENAGPSVSSRRSIDAEQAVGVQFEATDGSAETILFRRHLSGSEPIRHDTIAGDAKALAIGAADGGVYRWMLVDGGELTANGLALFSADRPADASGVIGGPAAAGLFRVRTSGAHAIAFHLPRRPAAVWWAPPNQPSLAEPIAFQWDDGRLTVDWPASREGVLWADPKFDLRQPPPPVTLTVRDSTGSYEVPLRTAVAENGEWIAFGEPGVREPGDYHLEASGPNVELLVQDRWTPRAGVRGVGSVTGVFRDKTELFFRFAPGGQTTTIHAALRESRLGQMDNLLRNGDFEEGIPGYPPRGWVVSRASNSDALSWPAWSQEDRVAGQSALKFVRLTDRMLTRAQPMRLTRPGRYLLRFYAKGNATEARVTIEGAQGAGGVVALEPSDDWREYRFETEMAPGYCEVVIAMEAGGEPKQVLWVDEIGFGPILPPAAAPATPQP